MDSFANAMRHLDLAKPVWLAELRTLCARTGKLDHDHASAGPDISRALNGLFTQRASEQPAFYPAEISQLFAQHPLHELAGEPSIFLEPLAAQCTNALYLHTNIRAVCDGESEVIHPHGGDSLEQAARGEVMQLYLRIMDFNIGFYIRLSALCTKHKVLDTIWEVIREKWWMQQGIELAEHPTAAQANLITAMYVTAVYTDLVKITRISEQTLATLNPLNTRLAVNRCTLLRYAFTEALVAMQATGLHESFIQPIQDVIKQLDTKTELTMSEVAEYKTLLQKFHVKAQAMFMLPECFANTVSAIETAQDRDAAIVISDFLTTIKASMDEVEYQQFLKVNKDKFELGANLRTKDELSEFNAKVMAMVVRWFGDRYHPGLSADKRQDLSGKVDSILVCCNLTRDFAELLSDLESEVCTARALYLVCQFKYEVQGYRLDAPNTDVPWTNLLDTLTNVCEDYINALACSAPDEIVYRTFEAQIKAAFNTFSLQAEVKRNLVNLPALVGQAEALLGFQLEKRIMLINITSKLTGAVIEFFRTPPSQPPGVDLATLVRVHRPIRPAASAQLP